MSQGDTQPGDVLRDAREAMNVSIREVADALNLPTRVVESIEANDFTKIQPTFARGYIRVYAKLFELEADPLVAQLDELVTDNSPNLSVLEAPEISLRLPSIDDKSKLVIIGAVVFIALIILLVVVFWPTGEAQSPTSSTNPITLSITNSQVDQVPATAGRSVQDDLPATDRQIPEDTVEQPVLFQEVVNTPIKLEPSVVVASLTPTSSPSGRRITTDGDDVLHFEFSEDCWVQVKTPEGGNLYSDLSRRGSSLDLIGNGPFRILLGYAPGATLQYNQLQVALKPHTRNNVASFVIGQ